MPNGLNAQGFLGERLTAGACGLSGVRVQHELMGQEPSPFPDASELLERAVLLRYPSMRAFQRATGIQHTLFAAMRRGILPGLETLTVYCRSVGVTFASVLAACWRLDLNKLPGLHLLSAPDDTILLSTKTANTGLLVPFASRVSALAIPGEIRPLTELFKEFDQQSLAVAENATSFHYHTVRVGDWSLFPLFQPGDFLLAEPAEHNAETLSHLCHFPRGIALVRRPHHYALGHLTQNGEGGFTLEAHPESGYPRTGLKPGEWKLIGIVRGYCASLRQRAIRPKTWHPPSPARGRVRVAAKSRFGLMARAARSRRGLSVEDVAQAICRLTPHLPGPSGFYLLSKSRIDNIESRADISRVNVFGLYALLAVYGLDYREALEALGCAIDDEQAVPIQELLGLVTPRPPMQIHRSRWFQTVLKSWRAIPWHFFELYPAWTSDFILYHGTQLAHPLAQPHCFLRVEKCDGLPQRPFRGVRQGLRWPLFVLETRHGTICSNAYSANGQVHLVPHPLLPAAAPTNGPFDLGRNVDLVGRVTGIASLLPASFGWN